MTLNTKAFALAGGIMWGLIMAVLTIITLMSGYAVQFVNLMADIYPGYTATSTGIIIGAFYGFLDGFIGCYIFAWLYGLIKSKVD